MQRGVKYRDMNWQGNWVDLVILIFLVIYLWDNWHKGIFLVLAEMGAVVVGLPVEAKVKQDVRQTEYGRGEFPGSRRKFGLGADGQISP